MAPERGSSDERITSLVARAFDTRLIPTGNLVVAVSGGQDSLALLRAIVDTAPVGAAIHAVHVDHGLRLHSHEDARRVARLARSMGVPAIVRRYDVGHWAATCGINTESAARAVRYRLLARAATSLGGGPIVTGHTGDDVVETLLLHLLRGSGLEGLGGLQPVQRLPIVALGPTPPRLGDVTGELTIVRPLLDVARWETAAYCEKHGLGWIVDDSNADVSLTRNRIRHHLLPLLETYNPAVRDSLRRLASLARDDARTLEALAEAGWQSAARVEPLTVSFDRRQLNDFDRGISSRLIRRAAVELANHVTLSFEQVERCLALAYVGAGSTRLSGGLEWLVNSQTARLVKSASP
jgi:tRNA(Ile)-lysidine synthase